jgi:hypothetical protein
MKPEYDPVLDEDSVLVKKRILQRIDFSVLLAMAAILVFATYWFTIKFTTTKSENEILELYKANNGLLKELNEL